LNNYTKLIGVKAVIKTAVVRKRFNLIPLVATAADVQFLLHDTAVKNKRKLFESSSYICEAICLMRPLIILVANGLSQGSKRKIVGCRRK